MSTLKLDTIASRDGTESTDVTNVINGSAKAWVNFDGTGTVAIRDSFNVASITDNGTGDYTVNFTNAMPNANYSLAHMCNAGSLTSGQPAAVSLRSAYTSSTLDSEAMTTTSFRINAGFGNTTVRYDVSFISIIVLR
jgi:hypothetical protein